MSCQNNKDLWLAPFYELCFGYFCWFSSENETEAIKLLEEGTCASTLSSIGRLPIYYAAHRGEGKKRTYHLCFKFCPQIEFGGQYWQQLFIVWTFQRCSATRPLSVNCWLNFSIRLTSDRLHCNVASLVKCNPFDLKIVRKWLEFTTLWWNFFHSPYDFNALQLIIWLHEKKRRKYLRSRMCLLSD